MSENDQTSDDAGAIQSQRVNLRVYLVEDSAHIRERVIESVAENCEGEVIGCAETEDEAVNGILHFMPDAVVLDIQLRVGNGFNVLRKLKSLPLALRPVFIVFSNFAETEFRRDAAREGAYYFLDKATEFKHLGRLLNTLQERILHTH